MNQITIYEKPTCTKCRQTKKLLDEAGVSYDLIHYFEDPIPPTTLKRLLKMLDMTPHDLMRTGEQVYRDLEIRKRDYTNDELIALMSKNPDLIQRPIVVKGDKAVLGRPPENVTALIKK